jgi:hypothetical protein
MGLLLRLSPTSAFSFSLIPINDTSLSFSRIAIFAAVPGWILAFIYRGDAVGSGNGD